MEQFLKKPIIEEILKGKPPRLVSKKSQVKKMLNIERKKSRSEFVKLMGNFDKNCTFSKEAISNSLN